MTTESSTANPGPLGLAAFALTTIALSLVNAGVFGIDLEMAIIPLALMFGGTVQLMVGMLEYREGNTFGLTAFTSYGAFWLWFGLLLVFTGNGIIPEVSAAAIGVVLVLWGVFSTGLWVSTFKLNFALWVVFLTLSVTFYLLGFGDLLGNGTLVTAGGWLGLFTGVGALYTSMAEVTNWSFDREVLPLGEAPLSESAPAAEPEPAVADD